MDSAEVGKYIESVAVRIGFHNGGSLAGTGVLYTLQAQKRAVVLNAGHVLQNDSHICPAVLSVWSKSGTKNISLDLSDSDDNKEVNIHYCTMAESMFLTLRSSMFHGTTGWLTSLRSVLEKPKYQHKSN